MFCRNCGTPADDAAQFCTNCGASLKVESAAVNPPAPAPEYPVPDTVPLGAADPVPPPPFGASGTYTPPQSGSPYPSAVVREPKQKLVAALLGIFLGWIGIHRFYLGYNTIGIVQLILGILGIFTCGVTSIASWIWGIIDGVLILTGKIRTDAQGVPLRD